MKSGWPVTAAALLIVALSQSTLVQSAIADLQASDRVHAFYYLWYGTPEHDGKYLHWNHAVLPHWTDAENNKHKDLIDRQFNPPGLIHTSYYPDRGLYSSLDPETLDAHMQQMKSAGIGVAVLSWWGRPDVVGTTDTQGVNSDRATEAAVRAAERNGMKVAFHLEPYTGRTVESVAEDLKYLLGKFRDSPAVLRVTSPKQAKRQVVEPLPLVYVYDSYHISGAEWARLLQPVQLPEADAKQKPPPPPGDPNLSIRGKSHDAVVLALYLSGPHGRDIVTGGFDGFYTYFAGESSYGSTTFNWPRLMVWAEKRSLIASLSVAPGYNDTVIRPWNERAIRNRKDGEFYAKMWAKATEVTPDIVSITSFNEWGEGTQIEPAASVKLRPSYEQLMSSGAYTDKDSAFVSRWAGTVYRNYGTDGPNAYLEHTKKHAEKFVAEAAHRYEAYSRGEIDPQSLSVPEVPTRPPRFTVKHDDL